MIKFDKIRIVKDRISLSLSWTLFVTYWRATHMCYQVLSMNWEKLDGHKCRDLKQVAGEKRASCLNAWHITMIIDIAELGLSCCWSWRKKFPPFFVPYTQIIRGHTRFRVLLSASVTHAYVPTDETKYKRLWSLWSRRRTLWCQMDKRRGVNWHWAAWRLWGSRHSRSSSRCKTNNRSPTCDQQYFLLVLGCLATLPSSCRGHSGDYQFCHRGFFLGLCQPGNKITKLSIGLSDGYNI